MSVGTHTSNPSIDRTLPCSRGREEWAVHNNVVELHFDRTSEKDTNLVPQITGGRCSFGSGRIQLRTVLFNQDLWRVSLRVRLYQLAESEI
jgi:hypothetical protein